MYAWIIQMATSNIIYPIDDKMSPERAKNLPNAAADA